MADDSTTSLLACAVSKTSVSRVRREKQKVAAACAAAEIRSLVKRVGDLEKMMSQVVAQLQSVADRLAVKAPTCRRYKVFYYKIKFKRASHDWSRFLYLWIG